MTPETHRVTQWPIRNFTGSEAVLHNDTTDSELVSYVDPTQVVVRNAILTFPGIVLNIWALVGLVRYKEFNRQYKTQVMSITVGDLTFNVLIILHSILQAVWVLPAPVCYALVAPGILLTFSNHYLALTIGLDRCFAVFIPIKYKAQANSVWRAALVVGVVGLLSLAASLVMFVGTEVSGNCNPFSVGTEAGLMLWGLSVCAVSLASVLIYGAIVFKLCAKRRHAVDHPAFVRQQISQHDSRLIYKITTQSLVLVFCICLTSLPMGIYLLRVTTAQDIAAEYGSTRFTIFLAAPFVATLIDPCVILIQLRAHSTLARAIRTKVVLLCFPRQPATNGSSG